MTYIIIITLYYIYTSIIIFLLFFANKTLGTMKKKLCSTLIVQNIVLYASSNLQIWEGLCSPPLPFPSLATIMHFPLSQSSNIQCEFLHTVSISTIVHGVVGASTSVAVLTVNVSSFPYLTELLSVSYHSLAVNNGSSAVW